MWCTRWFLPLVILPLPTAPPYFLAVFLISQFLHAKPCFYCTVLLTFVFSTSCYWQPVPIDAPLSRPVGNATTFREAILANLSLPPDVPTLEQSVYSSVPVALELKPASENGSVSVAGKGEGLLPPMIQLLDRCWCNVFSRSGLFEPTDVTRWEMESVDAARKTIEAKVRDALARERSSDGERAEGEGRSNDDSEQGEADSNAANDGSFSFHGLRELLFPTANPANTAKYRLKPASPSSHPAPAISEPSSPAYSTPPFSDLTDAPDDSLSSEKTETETETHVVADSSNKPTLTTTTGRRKLLRPYYDFRPYGVDITLDFRWNRDTHMQTDS